MGQELCKVQLDIGDRPENNYSTTLPDDVKDDVSYFFPLKPSSDSQGFNNDQQQQQISNYQFEYIKQIQNNLLVLTKSNQWEQINNDIDEKFIQTVLTHILEQCQKITDEQTNSLSYQQQLQTNLTTKLTQDENINTSFFTPISTDLSSEDMNQQRNTQLSYFAIQSLISILLILIKSAEKTDPTIVQQILTLANQLCGQLPMKSLSSSNALLFKSLEPLRDYIQDLSLSSMDTNLSKQTIGILSSFSIAKGSLKDLLPLLKNLIFNTKDIYNFQGLFTQMNNYLTATINKNNDDSEEKTELPSFNYLKSIDAYPNPQLTQLKAESFTGQLISSIILSHIDIDTELNSSSSEPPSLNSLSYEFQPNTFKDLFHIIQQLTKLPSANDTTNHILAICLKLFANHLQLLSSLKSDVPDLTTYANETELQTWYDLLFKLSFDENPSEIAKQASKALISVINLQNPSLNQKLSLFYQFISENKHSILIEQILTQLNKYNLLSSWIDILCEEKNFQILYSIIDLYFDKQNAAIQNMLFSFQYVLLSRLDIQNETKTFTDNQQQLSSLVIEYLTYILKKYVNETLPMTDLYNSILLGLCLMTNTEKCFHYEFIQPIFTAILPLLTEYYFKNPDNEYILCLIGKISHVLINGLPEDALELKHLNKLNLPIFSGGYVNNKKDNILDSNLAVYTKYESVDDDDEADKEFLLAIYNNRDDGAKLISKLKSFSKTKQLSIQKSIEDQVNQATAELFAVYVKHYRRIKLAQLELSQTGENMSYTELLSLYENASRIQSVFSTVKGQGGDCDELLKQIKLRTSFLLLSVKESDLIPLVKEDNPPTPIEQKAKKAFHYQRQHSHWTKARHVLKLLQNLFQACIRFKKIMVEKKRTNEQKLDSDSLLNRSIETFVYGDFYKSSTTTNDTEENKPAELVDELEKCLYRQYQRALIRLITYRFNKTFIQRMLSFDNKDKILSIYLPYLRTNEVDWSYYNRIQSSNIQLKHDISNTYYYIIKQVLSIPKLAENIFYLLNLAYETTDLISLHQDKIPEILFNSYVSLIIENSLLLNFIGFNWLQLYVYKLCEHIELNLLRNTPNQILQKQERFVFHHLLLNEIKSFKNKLESDTPTEKESQNTLKDLTLSWFIKPDESVQPALNRYLVLLVRSMHFYKHVLPVCATIDYLQEFLYIYSNNQSVITQLLVLRCLRYILPYVPNDAEGIAKQLIEKLLGDILNTIGEQKRPKAILSELIYLYRTILSIDLSWQTIAIEYLGNSLKSYLNLKSIENNNNKNEMNQLLATLSILGGFIESVRLGSIVKIETNEDTALGLVIDINETDKSYSIQYLETNQIESLPIEKLQLEIDVPAPNLFDYTEKVLDVLGTFLQNDTSNNTSLLFLQIQRRAIAVLSCLLNEKKTIELFMSKPYASILAKLSQSNIYPSDLLQFNKQHLEQYYLSLDRCKIAETENANTSESITVPEENTTSSSSANWNMKKVNPNPLVVKALSTSYNGWKPYASEDEVAFYKQGRIGAEDISIAPYPKDTANPQSIQECGNKHKYRGKIAPTYDTSRSSFPTYIVDSLQLSEGKWYYAVRLPRAGLVQIGWVTNGFTTSSGRGVGDDLYSWCYDGSRAVFFYNQGFYGQFDGYIWKENDVIGCGIDIDGKNTNIKYWLNGKFLGTAFAHDVNVPLSDTKCDLLPNGPSTTYYPGVTLSISSDPSISVELIVSPEDMGGCPLPYGYKPLLLPKAIEIENKVVDYPLHAYLIGANSPEDSFLRKQEQSSSNRLRDFVNDKYIETTFNIENNSLTLPENSDGLLLSLDNDDISSLTVSFDYQILSTDENKLEFILAKLDSMEIAWSKTNQKHQCAVIVLSKKRQIKVYVDQQCQTYDDAFQYENLQKFTLHLLPGVSAQIKNLAIWKYPLSEEQISRLFSYGLSYIANDYQQLKEYRKRVNTISFSKNQQYFQNGLFVPFNETFTETLWKKKKQQADENEPKLFKSHDNQDYSTVDLDGNKTYLVLNKADEEWSNYSLLLNISIPQWPSKNDRLTIIQLNPKAELYITQDGKLCLDTDGTTKESESSLTIDEYVQLFIRLDNQSIKIYVNDELKLDVENLQDRFQIKSNHIDLFKQIKNSITDDTLRLSLKSVTYLNRSVPIDQLQSPTLTSPKFENIGSSLIAMGYKKHWIESLLNQNITKNLATILREQKEQLIKQDFDGQQNHYLSILSKINPSISPDLIKDLINSSKFDTNEQILNTAEYFSTYLLASQATDLSTNKSDLDDNWFSQAVDDLSIPSNLNEWLQNITSITDDNIYQLFDINEATKKKTIESIEYSHENLSSEQYHQSHLNCEQGLVTIYARTTIVNMFKIYSYDSSSLFPLDKFNDYSVLKLLDPNKLDQISSIIKSILKNEFQHLSDQNQTPLFNYLQKEIIVQLTEIVLKPSLLKQIDVNFILKMLNLFVELLGDKSIIKQDQIDTFIPMIFTISLINLIFDLFLLNPNYQIKVSIVYLYNNLLRLSDKLILSSQIQQFFFQLLIELETNKNTPRKRLQLALTDLIYLLRRKENNQIQEYETKLSENIRDLYLTTDVIDAWLDSNKQKLLPEKFLEQSKNLLAEEYVLNEDDFKKSNESFNTNADKELITYMNEVLLNNSSFTDLIGKLPKETEADPVFYKNYVLLSNLPADCVQIRARFIYLLNEFIQTKFSAVDFTLASEQSFLTDQIRRIKSYLLCPTKFALFGESIEKTEASYRSDYLNVNFDTVKASTENTKPENTMFYQAYQQLHAKADVDFRRSNDHVWQAQYLGMHSTDGGGPFRDSVTRICSDICSTRLPLFILCPNGRTSSGLNRDCWIPNAFAPNKSIPKKYQKQYRFVGQLMGMAIRHKHYLDIKFPQLLWKRLLNEDLTVEDIEAIDIQSFAIINEMEKNIEQIKSFETDQDINSFFSSIMSDLHFDVVSSSGQTFELIPGGQDISITAKNFKQYCSLYRQYRLKEFNRQISFIQQGLYSVVPSYYLSLFTSNEVEELVCGKGRIDIEILKRNTVYGGYFSETSPSIARFWTVMSDMFTDEQRKQFLIFVWGRSTLPTRDQDFSYKFTINSHTDYGGGEVDKTLPRSHTCYFTIDLPAYGSEEIMYERLSYAISSCSSIDGDGAMNDEPNLEQLHFDDDDM